MLTWTCDIFQTVQMLMYTVNVAGSTFLVVGVDLLHFTNGLMLTNYNFPASQHQQDAFSRL